MCSILSWLQCVNTLWPGGARCYGSRSTLLQVMACHLFKAKPLPEPVLTYCQLGTCRQTSVRLKIKIKYQYKILVLVLNLKSTECLRETRLTQYTLDIWWSLFFTVFTRTCHSSPMRVRFGLSVVSSKSEICFALLIVELYAILGHELGPDGYSPT